MEDQKHKYGYATVGLEGVPKEIPIQDYLQATYKDHRLASIVSLGDEGYIIAVENPISSGRGAAVNMWLSEESLIGLISTCLLYFNMKGDSLEDKLRLAARGDEIDYQCSDNLQSDNPVKPITG